MVNAPRRGKRSSGGDCQTLLSIPPVGELDRWIDRAGSSLCSQRGDVHLARGTCAGDKASKAGPSRRESLILDSS
eukprot:scaffold7551_cov168-Amphora_coffeaeformis.AAC.8